MMTQVTRKRSGDGRRRSGESMQAEEVEMKTKTMSASSRDSASQKFDTSPTVQGYERMRVSETCSPAANGTPATG